MNYTTGLSTRQLAKAIGVVDGTIRVRLCTKGSYFGLKPLARLPNGRLLWPADSVERLMEAGRTIPAPVVGRKRDEAAGAEL